MHERIFVSGFKKSLTTMHFLLRFFLAVITSEVNKLEQSWTRLDLLSIQFTCERLFDVNFKLRSSTTTIDHFTLECMWIYMKLINIDESSQRWIAKSSFKSCKNLVLELIILLRTLKMNNILIMIVIILISRYVYRNTKNKQLMSTVGEVEDELGDFYYVYQATVVV